MLFKEANRKWWILFAMTSCISMIFIDVTVLPVALPTIQRQFNASPESLQWILNGYTLALCVFVLAGGRLGDVWGQRKTFCLGLFLFSISSALCGLSSSINTLIISRFLQGIGGAILIPTSSALLFSSFPLKERGKALGLYVSIGSIFLAIGPFLGGTLTQYSSWRMIFFINLPIAAVGYILTMISVHPSKGRKQSFDWVGFITLASGISSVIIALMQGNTWGWGSLSTLGALIFGIGSITALILAERQIEHPLIDFTLYKNKIFVGANTSIFCNQLQLCTTVFWAMYLQNSLGYSPAMAGMLSFLSNAPVLFVATLAGSLVDKYGPRIPVITGFCLIFVSLVVFMINPQPSLPLLIGIFIPYGCGIPLVFTPSFTSAMSHVDDSRRGMVSAMSTMARQFSTTLGIALFTVLLVGRQKGEFASLLESNTLTARIDPIPLEGLVSKTPAALQALKALPDSTVSYVISYADKAYTSAFTLVNGAAAAFSLIGLLLAYFLLAKAKPAHLK
ncbi:MAG: MFS transporter [Chlamydiae bacterium]|nr:MFS transporter [Chlamydiota bacterium]